MKIEFEKCTITDKELRLTARFTATFEDLEEESNSPYRLDRLANIAVQIIAKTFEIAHQAHKQHSPKDSGGIESVNLF